MKYIKQFAIIATMTFLGECCNLLIPLSIPSSIYGMVLLFVSLQTGILKLEQIEETADFLLGIMPIFFVAPTVSLMTSMQFIKGSIVGIFIICLLSTVVVMAVTGFVSQAVIRRGKKKGGRSHE
jgi:holin-like protein